MTSPSSMRARAEESGSQVGLIGLAVMGENLALNIEGRGYSVCVYNRTVSRTNEFLAGRAHDRNIVAAQSLREFVAALETPRCIFILVKAGEPVDALLAELVPLLSPGDIVIDGGNSHFVDTIRRSQEAEQHGLLYVGSGVSGGEIGALRGPSLMPGGNAQAWPRLRPLFEAIAARSADDAPCCAWIGPGGSGHFVKMVHNGIEYGDMQAICEVYDLMRRGLGLGNEEMARVFAQWNEGELSSYLIEITRDILQFRNADGEAPIDLILDKAGQKGTGKWTLSAALDEAVPLTLIAEAVFARFLSAAKDERVAAAEVLSADIAPIDSQAGAFIEDLRAALYAAKIVSYAQGFTLLRAAATSHDWQIDCATIARIWRGGCIIRSVFLNDIARAFDKDADLVSLLFDPYFKTAVESRLPAWRRVVAAAVTAGIPVPCLSAALAWWDGYRSERLPANLLQAQRDYFGAHLFERIDRPRGEFFHEDWTG